MRARSKKSAKRPDPSAAGKILEIHGYAHSRTAAHFHAALADINPCSSQRMEVRRYYARSSMGSCRDGGRRRPGIISVTRPVSPS